MTLTSNGLRLETDFKFQNPQKKTKMTKTFKTGFKNGIMT